MYEKVLVGENEVLVIKQESTAPIAKGVAIILGESGETPLSQQTISPLATELNGVGWVTLQATSPNFSISLPEENVENDSTQQVAEPADILPFQFQHAVIDNDIATHQQTMILYMEALSNLAADYDGFFLVIAHGTTAAWLSKLYHENALGSPDGFVVISPFFPFPEENDKLPMYISESGMPLLDIHRKWESNWASKTLKARQTAAAKSLKVHYRQRTLSGQRFSPDQIAWLAKEIHGWSTHMGW